MFSASRPGLRIAPDIQDKCHFGDERNDGLLLSWAREFAKKTDLAVQGEVLERLQSAKLPESAHLSQLEMFFRNIWRNGTKSRLSVHSQSTHRHTRPDPWGSLQGCLLLLTGNFL